MSLHMKRQGLYANTLERIRGGSELGLDEEFNPLRVPRSRSHVDVEGFGDAIFEASDTFDIINGTEIREKENLYANYSTTKRDEVKIDAMRNETRTPSKQENTHQQDLFEGIRNDKPIIQLEGKSLEPGRVPRNKYDYPIWEYEEHSKFPTINNPMLPRNAINQLIDDVDALVVDSDNIGPGHDDDSVLSKYALDESDIMRADEEEELEHNLLLENGYERHNLSSSSEDDLLTQ
eukprot:CAMPEP_0167754660 /NCGR_PEP_ID=MMETSP0110_2-20121227/8394_1 /TAXON_ID=629695 /ORGANISM="Gymnochlora sp., Strain CCMP2014" /LENGTH=233 /DNA_ID=CAMNT_0007640565 /DNA_START=124 /DNA_END=825 /DNA_ORIENTATION=+